TAAGTTVAVTVGLAEELGARAGNAVLIPFVDKMDLMNLPREQLDRIRNHLLAPLGVQMSAPSRVALYLYDEDLVVLENFNDEAAHVSVSLDERFDWEL